MVGNSRGSRALYDSRPVCAHEPSPCVQQVTDAVVTVPAYFNDSQRQATKVGVVA